MSACVRKPPSSIDYSFSQSFGSFSNPTLYSSFYETVLTFSKPQLSQQFHGTRKLYCMFAKESMSLKTFQLLKLYKNLCTSSQHATYCNAVSSHFRGHPVNRVGLGDYFCHSATLLRSHLKKKKISFHSAKMQPCIVNMSWPHVQHSWHSTETSDPVGCGGWMDGWIASERFW